MALFTDGPISTIEDLRREESSLLDTAATEGIDLDAKVLLAQEEIGIELDAYLSRVQSSSIELDRVVVTPALRRWHRLRTLGLVFRDAYYNQLNDRYGKKWEEYERLAKLAFDQLKSRGVGYVSAPLPRPATPTVNSIAGSFGAGSYFVCVTWTGWQGAESAPSETTCHVTLDNSNIEVIPPAAPAGATGWNVYAGVVEDALSKQNGVALPLDAMWVLPPAGLVNGQPPPSGQLPEQYLLERQVMNWG